MTNRCSAWVLLCGMGLCGVGCAAPAGDGNGDGSVHSYGAELAALGAATLRCMGRVSPDLYTVDDGRLSPTFQECTRDASAASEIEHLIALQQRDDALREFFVTSWLDHPVSDASACPTWQAGDTINAPTVGGANTSVQETYTDYTVTAADCPDGACAVDRARQCAAPFGASFVVDVDPAAARVTIDPTWWLSTTDYSTPYTNPFLTIGYYHAMATYGSYPGAQYGAVERYGEPCSKYIGGWLYTNRTLGLIYCGSSLCATVCQ